MVSGNCVAAMSTDSFAHHLYKVVLPGMMTLQSTWAYHLAEGARGKAKISTGLALCVLV